jgi:hypothetical protein
MVRSVAGVVGLAIFVLAIGAGITLFSISQNAQLRDQFKQGNGVVSGETPLCAWDIDATQRVLSENSSHTVTINATNANEVDCESVLRFLAPGFDVRPREEEQLVTAKPNGRGSIAWIVTPLKSGSFEIVVSDGIDTRVIGVTVTNILGLTAAQAQILSVLGTLFGPMFTIPWWVERWQQRKRQQAKASVTSVQ